MEIVHGLELDVGTWLFIASVFVLDTPTSKVPNPTIFVSSAFDLASSFQSD